MNAHDAVLHILRCGIWGTPFEGDSAIDWPVVYGELKSQAVTGLVDSVLMKYCPDSALKREWSMEILHRLNYNEQNLFSQASLLTLLEEKDIPVAILKGAAAARFYPHPEKRTLGDVDCLVPVERFDEALELLKAHGYQQKKELIEGDCEILLEKDHVLFELHRGIKATDVVNGYVVNGLNHVEQHAISGCSFSVLSEPANGLVLISHIRQHLENGLGLRQIIDWMMYVDRCVPDQVWKDSFQKVAHECGLEKLAISVTRMCQMYLGLTEDITWCASADESACASLMDYILERGNFGRKIEQSERSTQRIMMKKNYLWQLITTLQSKGMTDRKVIKRYPCLRPFAWAIQIGYYVKQTFRRGNVAQTLRSDKAKARQMREMFEALGIME